MYLTLFLSILSVSSRGLFELFFDKGIAYLFSVGLFFLFYLAFILSQGARVVLGRWTLVICAFFMFSAACSALFSLVNGRDSVYTAYLIYPLSVVLVYVSFDAIRVDRLNLAKVYGAVAGAAAVLVSVAIAQQFGFISLPGATPLFYTFSTLLERPSSLTGSYLHYPLVIVLLGFVLYALKGRLTILSAICVAAPFYGFSRSGIVLVVVALAAEALIYMWRGRASKRFYLYAPLAFSLGVVAVYYSDFYKLISQVFGSFGTSGIGNSGRFEAWILGAQIYSDGNLLLGEQFGEVTNLSRNMFDADSIVVESGLLQNLINFGLIGAISFYALFVRYFFVPGYRLVKIFIAAFLFQNLFYQSHEVVPFLFLILLFISLTRQLFLSQGREAYQ